MLTVDGVTKSCSTCREVKPVSDYWKNRAQPDGLHSQCKDCNKAARNDLRRRVGPQSGREWNRANPHYALSRKGVDVSADDYFRLLAEQGGRCAICGHLPRDTDRRLCIDHDHGTLAVRGLLCDSCNRAIGMMRDDPQRLLAAARYLQR